jgi:pyruvate/2-oxoglutarate dehydrogenase complex dihydrolipoamide dehydrogenase (E3) component
MIGNGLRSPTASEKASVEMIQLKDHQCGHTPKRLPERISKAAHRLLVERDIEVRTDAKVVEVRAAGLRLADGSFLDSERVVGAAKPRRDEVNRTGRLVVEPTLQTTSDPNIFAIGDCARSNAGCAGRRERCSRHRSRGVPTDTAGR